jgi:pyridoxal phosphate enzyme (YggS family)
MVDIESNIHDLEKRITGAAERADRSPTEITLVTVTKTIAPTLIRRAFEVGIRHFGENRVQEAQSKIEKLSSLRPPATWHMVGHLQTNKAKLAVGLFDMIQSIDSVKLAEAISRHAQRNIPILIQVNVVEEASKSGFSLDKVSSAVKEIARLPRLEIKGLMTIAPLTSDPEEVRPVFKQLRLLRDSLGLEHLSMGMTDDFEVAIEEGATIVRIGRAIFGERGG